MPRSVNVNDGFWGQRTIEDGPDNPSGMNDSGDFVLEPPRYPSADPHRTLQPGAGLIVPSPSTERVPSRGSDLRRGPAGKVASQKASTQADQGPCLYFGPAGERCDRRAVDGGYCARHQQSRVDWTAPSSSTSLPQISKRAIGAAGIIAVLWPILADLIREIIRLLR